MITGGCHCGAIRYQAEGEALTHALCHCTDCRRHAGAPMVGWTMYPQDAVKVTKGTPKIYASRSMAGGISAPTAGPDCSTRTQTCCRGSSISRARPMTIPTCVPARAHVQVAERIGWMERAHELPAFERYPPQE